MIAGVTERIADFDDVTSAQNGHTILQFTDPAELAEQTEPDGDIPSSLKRECGDGIDILVVASSTVDEKTSDAVYEARNQFTDETERKPTENLNQRSKKGSSTTCSNPIQLFDNFLIADVF